MNRRLMRRALGVVAALVAAVLFATGCGLVSSSGTFEKAALPGGDKPLDGAKITVTSKSFTEGVLLGKITATYLAAAGANVSDLTGAPGSASSRQAQLNGDADILWEYTGTAWVTYHSQTETISDPNELWQKVYDLELNENNLVWLPPANFNDTYAFAASKQTIDRLKVKSLSDVARLPIDERSFCVDDEFFSRQDGFNAMLNAYGIPSPTGVKPEKVTKMDAGVVYASTAKGAPCNFGMVYTTDGRIKNLDLTVLDDDKKFFLPYSGTAIVRKSVLDAHPDIKNLIGEVSQRLTEPVMQELNGYVDINGQDPSAVAYDWLKKERLIA